MDERSVDEKAPGAPALDREPLLLRVARVHEIAGARGEIVHRDLLRAETGRLVPRFAVFAAAAYARVGVDPALLDPRLDAGIEVGLLAQAVAAVAVEDGGS